MRGLFTASLHTLLRASVVAAVTACAALPRAPGEETEPPSGLAVVSLTMSGMPMERLSSFSYRLRAVGAAPAEAVKTVPQFESTTAHARWVQIEARRPPRAWQANIKARGLIEPLDISNGEAGTLALLKLPAGDYQFYAWQAEMRDPHGVLQYRPAQEFSYRFRVEPAQTSYHGQLNLQLEERGRAVLSVEDRRDRDLAILARKLPTVQIGSIVTRVGRLEP